MTKALLSLTRTGLLAFMLSPIVAAEPPGEVAVGSHDDNYPEHPYFRWINGPRHSSDCIKQKAEAKQDAGPTAPKPIILRPEADCPNNNLASEPRDPLLPDLFEEERRRAEKEPKVSVGGKVELNKFNENEDEREESSKNNDNFEITGGELSIDILTN